MSDSNRGAMAGFVRDALNRFERHEQTAEDVALFRNLVAMADPPTEGPKVVGWVTKEFAAANNPYVFGTINTHRIDLFSVPLILQSEHEEVVRGKMDILHRVAEKSQERQAEITRLKAENEGLREDRNDLQVRLDNANEAVEIEEAENKQVREANELLRRERDGEVWCWQGDEYDHPESLACPVLIGPDDLRAILAENERLAEEVEAVQRLRRIDRDSFASEKAGLEGALKVAANTIESLEAQRDAYADPANWRPEWTKTPFAVVHDAYCHYTGPTPSDSTEADEGESVEGAVRFRGGNWTISHDRIPDAWPEGARVKITKLPETGGNDGDS